MTSETTTKKNIQKLQRAIVDGLEDVKAQDIQVFNTEGLSPLFERVIVASGTSNRQTKALAASVRDAVKEAGFDKPRTEGEENGEWIIVDCGQAVVHVMQPTIRQYYRLEEIWGETPVRLKSGEAKAKAARAAAEKANAASAAKAADKKTASKKTAEVAPVDGKVLARKAGAKASSAGAVKKAPAGKTAPVKAGAKTAAKTAPKTAVKTAAKTPARKAPAKKAAPLPVVKIGAPARKAAVKSTAKPAAKSAAKPKAAPKKKA